MDKGAVIWVRDRYCVQLYWKGKQERFWRYPDGSGVMLKGRDHLGLAKKLLNKIQSEIDTGTFVAEAYKPDSPLSLRVYGNHWLKACTVRKMTKKGYRAAVNHACRFFKDSQDIRHISYNKIKEFYKHMTTHFALKTAYNVLTALKTMLKDAHRDGKIIAVPPFPPLKNPKPMDTPYLTYEEQQEVLSHIPERHRPIYEMGMEYGLRIEEVRALKWDCVTETNITIRRSMPEYELIESTKEDAVRVEEITTRARDILRRARLNPSWKGYVFTASKRGAPYDYKFMSRTWKAACNKVGISIHMYQGFRHSYCSQLADMGLGIDVIQKSVGHADRRSTERYTRRQRASERRLINEARGQVIDIANRLRTEIK